MTEEEGHNMDYFALDRPRLYMPLSRAALAAKFPDVDDLGSIKLESDWHPCVVLDARPTKGAGDFILRQQGAVAEAQRKAQRRVAPMVDEELAAMSREDIEAEIKAEIARARGKVDVPPEAAKLDPKQREMIVGKLAEPRYTTVRTYRQWLIEESSVADGPLLDAVGKVTAVRVAVCVHGLTGDWSLYASSWGEASPVWPQLHEDGALEARLSVVAKLAGEDIDRINGEAERLMAVTREEAGKSEPPPS